MQKRYIYIYIALNEKCIKRHARDVAYTENGVFYFHEKYIQKYGTVSAFLWFVALLSTLNYYSSQQHIVLYVGSYSDCYKNNRSMEREYRIINVPYQRLHDALLEDDKHSIIFRS